MVDRLIPTRMAQKHFVAIVAKLDSTPHPAATIAASFASCDSRSRQTAD
jgi:hypothetical protein